MADNIIKTSIKVDKPWGWEVVFTPPDLPYTGKVLFVKKGARNSLQYHEEKKESLTLFAGKAKLHFNGEWLDMEKDVGYTINPGDKHRIEALEDSYIIEASTTEAGKTLRLEDDYGRGDETEEDRKKDHKSA